jgi:hypothetical protein
MATSRRNLTVYHNTTNLQGRELEIRTSNAEGQLEEFKHLFERYINMTKWEARRRYIEHHGDIDEIQPGARIDALVEKGIIYKSTEKWPEERGATNFVYKLYPTDGTVPEDYNNKIPKIIVHIQFNEDGTVNGELTTELFIDKLVKIENKYSL